MRVCSERSRRKLSRRLKADGGTSGCPKPVWGKSVGLLVPNLEPSGPAGAGGPRGCKSGLPSGIGNEPEAMLMARMLARLDGECA